MEHKNKPVPYSRETSSRARMFCKTCLVHAKPNGVLLDPVNHGILYAGPKGLKREQKQYPGQLARFRPSQSNVIYLRAVYKVNAPVITTTETTHVQPGKKYLRKTNVETRLLGSIIDLR